MPQPLTTRRLWIAVSAIFALSGALFGAWAARIPAIAELFQLGHAEIGMALLFLAGGAVCAFPLAGRWIDRSSSTRVMWIFSALYPFTLIALPLMPNAWGLSMALFVFGAVHGAMDIAMNAWAAEVERHCKRAMMSSFHAMFSLGAGLGALSGYLASSMALSPLVHFTAFGAVMTGLALLLAWIPWTNAPGATDGDEAGFGLPKGALLLVGLFAACSSVGEGAMADWSAIYLRDAGNASEEIAALGYAAFSVAMVILRLSGDHLTNRLGPVRVARLSAGFAMLGVALAVVLPVPSAILPAFALMGVGYALVVPLAFSRAANDPDVPAGQALASVATLGYGAMLIGPPLIGFLADLTSLRGAFLLLLALAVIAMGLAGVLKPPAAKS